MEDDKSRQLEQAMRKMIEENFYAQFLGMEFVKLRKGYSLSRMKFRKELTNPYGYLHGGSLYSLADITAGASACMCGHYVTTVSGSLNFLLPARDTEYIYCEAEELRQGRHLAVFEIKIRDDKKRIIDSGEFTFFVMDGEVLKSKEL